MHFAIKDDKEANGSVLPLEQVSKLVEFALNGIVYQHISVSFIKMILYFTNPDTSTLPPGVNAPS
jgi:hypothetical protein